MSTAKVRYPWFVKGDLDGFFGLAVDNLVQVLVIVALCTKMCGFTDDLIYGRVLPGIAVSLLIGNIFYAIHAHYVARRDRNPTCTALPYGINTPSVFAYIFFVMAPVYNRFVGELGQAGAANLAWKVGLAACIGSGIIEFLGAFVGGWIRRVTPRAALLSALAAIAVIFIASPFAFQIFERPLVAILPMFVVLIGYFAKVRFPAGLPSGLVALVLGTILAWAVPLVAGPQIMSPDAVREAVGQIRQTPLHLPQHCWADLVALLTTDPKLVLSFLGIIIPMGLINAMGSLQNVESAEAAGDRFHTGACMAVNGVGSMAAGLFGSCFPTTIYIGHPGWKALGARSGYSIINGAFFTLVFLLGLGALVVNVIPMEAGMAIVMWIGIVITAQSYETVPARHYPAVAIAFFPAVAMMAILFVPQILSGVGASHGILPMLEAHTGALENPQIRTDSWWPVGVYALAGANSGFIITSIIVSAVSAFLIDRRFKTAAIWCIVAAAATLLGFQHAYRVKPDPDPPRTVTVQPQELLVWQRGEAAFQGTSLYLEKAPGEFWHRGYRIAGAYAAAAVLLLLIHWARKGHRGFADIDVDGQAMPPPEAPPSPPAPSFAPPTPSPPPLPTLPT